MSLLRHVENCLANQKSFKVLNAFIPHQNRDTVFLEAAKQADRSISNEPAPNPIHGRLIAVKDNICTLGYPTTCGSHILEGFQSPYNAHVVQKLHDAGAIIAGKTNLDEFGMGSHSTNSIFGPVYNVNANSVKRFSVGGSSGGSALAVATGQCWAALGTDTGGSVRLPAAYTGVVGFKPSYGLISRHGVIAYANSLDTVGILAPTSSIAKLVFDEIKGHHARDPTSISLKTLRHIAQLSSDRESRRQGRYLRIGIPMEYNIAELEPVIRASWLKAIRILEEQGHSIHQVSLPATKLALSAYYVIAPAEASSNLAKFDGVRFGNQAAQKDTSDNVLYSRTRGEGLGKEVKKRILLGAYTLSASAIDNYFIKAQRVRRLVQQDFDAVFAFQNPLLDQHQEATASTLVDALLSPTAPSVAPRLASLVDRSSVDTYRDDVLTVPASLAGLPAMSIPVKLRLDDGNVGHNIEDFTGLQIIAQYGDDDMVFKVADALAEITMQRY